jgi:hypothetical protein
VQRLRTIDNLSSPFVTLPHELTRDIISLAVNGAGDRRAILGLSQVSQKLRRTVLDMSWLFTEANWDDWPCPLLELWCRCAGTQLLTICLDDTTISGLSLGATPELQALLESYSPQWGVLYIDVYARNTSDRVLRLVGQLLEHSSPSLHILDFRCSGPFIPLSTDRPRLHCLPGLQVLCLKDIWPVFSASPTSVTDLTCVCGDLSDWLHWLDIFGSCQLVQRLILDLTECDGFADEAIMSSTAQLVLPSLRHLEIKGMLENDSSWISRFLSCCDAPNLESMAVQPHDTYKGLGVNGWPIMVRNQSSYFIPGSNIVSQASHIASIKSLSINMCHGLGTVSYTLLNSLTEHPMILPHLTELHLLPNDWETFDNADLGEIIQTFLLQRRSITHLTTPPFRDNDVMEFLKEHVSYLQVRCLLSHNHTPLILLQILPGF